VLQIMLASPRRSGHSARVHGRRVVVVALVAASLAVSACSDGGGPREQPTNLSLSAAPVECVSLTRGGDEEAAWCAPGITEFIIELLYENPKDRYGLLLVVNARVLPSADYVIWDEVGKFVLVASSHSSVSLRELTYVVQSEGQILHCSGETRTLHCTPESG
jgi:hypothetical protein